MAKKSQLHVELETSIYAACQTLESLALEGCHDGNTHMVHDLVSKQRELQRLLRHVTLRYGDMGGEVAY